MNVFPNDSDDRQRVRDASDIVDVVGEHVTLKAKGREYVGLCPFHDDHNPSMAVVPHKQIFHCFVCGSGGDVFTFVQKFHSMTFPEALEHLATRAGIELVPRAAAARKRADDGGAVSRQELVSANQLANAFFRSILTHEQHGAPARDVIRRRGISPEMVEHFQLGAAPHRWDGLLLTARRKGVADGTLVAAGLAKHRERSQGAYDAFRHRLVFPIHDQIGRAIAFGARRIDEDDDPKYLNSPETPLFNKSTTLYALHQASRSIQRQRTAVVVEGYTDAIACHQAGIDNVVATLGTALTPGHAKALRRLCDEVILVFDGDEAGLRAADRAFEVLFAEPIDLRIATLAAVTDAKDPDELLKRDDGPELFRRMLEEAPDLLEYRFARMRRRLRDAGIAEQARVVESELERLADLGLANQTPVRRTVIRKRLAETLGVPESVIAEAMPVGRRAGRAPRRVDAGPPRDTGAAPASLDEGPRTTILACLLVHDSLWLKLTRDQRALIHADAYRSPMLAAVADALVRVIDRGDDADLAAVINELDAVSAERGCDPTDASAAATSLYHRVDSETEHDAARTEALLFEAVRRVQAEREPAAPSDQTLADRLALARKLHADLGANPKPRLITEPTP